MKLVLQIAGGILLALAVVVGSIAAYKYVQVQVLESHEMDALRLLNGLTPNDVVNRCGAPVYQTTKRVLDENWLTFTYLSPVTFKSVDLTLSPLSGAEKGFYMEVKHGDALVTAWAEKARLLPCLAHAQSAGTPAASR